MTGAAPVWREPPVGGLARANGGGETANLADILERILHTGIVIAGDIKVSLLDIELLTVKIRLLVMSVDKARELGIDWWEHDPALSSRHTRLALENEALRQRVSALESGRAVPHLEGAVPHLEGTVPHLEGAVSHLEGEGQG